MAGVAAPWSLVDCPVPPPLLCLLVPGSSYVSVWLLELHSAVKFTLQEGGKRRGGLAPAFYGDIPEIPNNTSTYISLART